MTISSRPDPAQVPPPREAEHRRSAPERDLLAWKAAVEHLHAAGLPAAVPEFPAAWLRRCGIRPDWEAAA
jgi:hypothetical protein